MSISNHLVFSRWADAVRENAWPTNGKGRELSMDGSSVLADLSTIYSYGRHFPMAQVIRNKNGTVRLILVNGDTASVTTSQHQSACRATVQGMGYPFVIIPFSALDAASIERDSIELVEARPDRNETRQHRSEEPPGTSHPTMDDPEGATVVQESYLYNGTLDIETNLYHVPAGGGRWMTYGPNRETDPDNVTRSDEQPYPEPPSSATDYDAWTEWRARYRQHASVKVAQRVPLQVPNPDRVYVGRSNWNTAERCDDGVWRWETHRHWLGDSCFRARVTERTMVTEWGPAVESGRQAWDLGYHALRSGLHPEHGRSPYPNGGWAVNTHERVKRRRAYFLSSFDYNEAQPLYFLCELPRKGRPASVEEAYELLKPPEVLAAEAQGLEINRQGDVFAIACPELTNKDIRSMLRRGERIVKRRHVLGTEHSTSEVALCKDGLTFGKGTMYHDVSWPRERDHARRRMADGKTWHLLVRNTVPRAT